MDAEIIEGIPFAADAGALLSQAGLEPESDEAARLRELCAEAGSIARPKGMFRQAWVEEKGGDFLVIEGQRFTSRILRVNLDKVHRVVAYVLTCGVEVDRWAAGLGDPLEQWWGDMIKLQALRAVSPVFEERLTAAVEMGPTSTMNPGSLADWPLAEQGPLFRLLGDVEGAIGVRLTDSFLMMPNKSVSGLRFSDDTGHVNCRLCPRKVCPGRRAPYDENLLRTRFGRAPSEHG